MADVDLRAALAALLGVPVEDVQDDGSAATWSAHDADRTRVALEWGPEAGYCLYCVLDEDQGSEGDGETPEAARADLLRRARRRLDWDVRDAIIRRGERLRAIAAALRAPAPDDAPEKAHASRWRTGAPTEPGDYWLAWRDDPEAPRMVSLAHVWRYEERLYWSRGGEAKGLLRHPRNGSLWPEDARWTPADVPAPPQD